MSRWFETDVRARSYELDAFGHVNHAVYLNYFEEARIRALEEAGFPVADVLARGEGVAVVRLEVEYLKEVLLGQVLRIRTRFDRARRTSVAVVQEAVRPAPTPTAGPLDAEESPSGPEVVCRARVVWVWLDRDRRPRRVPTGVREALRSGPGTAGADSGEAESGPELSSSFGGPSPG